MGQKISSRNSGPAAMRGTLFVAILIQSAVQAEVVGVKGFGDVNLADFDCTAISESRLLHQICYNETHRYLIAQIGDRYYESCDVSSKTVNGLMNSEQVVAYYNKNIRLRHKCTPELRNKTGAATLSHSIR